MARPQEYSPPTAETPVQPEDANNLVIQLPQVLQDDPIANPANSSLVNEDAPAPEIPDIILGVVNDARKVKYLIALVELGNRSRAARIARTTTATVWQWRRSDTKFAAAEKRAMEVAVDLAEDELVRRATEGVVEPVFQGGRLVGGVRKLSDALLMFYLKANREKYKDKIDVNATIDIADRLIKARERTFGRLPQGVEEKE